MVGGRGKVLVAFGARPGFQALEFRAKPKEIVPSHTLTQSLTVEALKLPQVLQVLKRSGSSRLVDESEGVGFQVSRVRGPPSVLVYGSRLRVQGLGFGMAYTLNPKP